MRQAKWPHINGRFLLPTEIANPLCLAYAMLRHSSASRFFWQKRPTVEVKAFFVIPSFLKSWVFVRLRVMDKLTLFFSVQEAYIRSQLLFGNEEEDGESASRIKTAEIQGIMKIFAVS